LGQLFARFWRLEGGSSEARIVSLEKSRGASSSKCAALKGANIEGIWRADIGRRNSEVSGKNRILLDCIFSIVLTFVEKERNVRLWPVELLC